MNGARQAFEDILKLPRCASPAPVFDPVSARIAAEAGFGVALLAGSSASIQILGAPDLVLITLSELAEQTRRITRVSELPLIVDADHGFGNALSVMRTVEELSRAGAAALTIEDTLLPASFGRSGERDVIGMDEALGKLRAACHAASASPIAVIARTDLAATGLAGGIARISAYSEVPVSAVFVSGARSRADIDAISAATHLPLLLGAIPDAIRDRDYLAARRVRLFNQGHQPLQASIQAVYAAMMELKHGPAPAGGVPIASREMLARLSNEPAYRDWGASFLEARGA